jgi:bifunctional DNA-binding transcriptional regulator/antitoxin component of YhaV-PrlF toxin-antitoxin module
LGIAPGDVLVAVVDDQRLVLEKREAVLGRLRKRFAHIPEGVSLADELIAERRAESRRED